MFEFSIATKYLLPRWRQLSISIISCISILVISLVVWLIVVFFSVTDGLENSWINKLTALTAPVRITPTEAYHQSYYYLIDSVSSSSDYKFKTIHEKLSAPSSNPYDPEIDQEVPSYWPEPDTQPNGELKDPVKLIYAAISELPSHYRLKVDDFELTMSHIQLKLLRPANLLTDSSDTGSEILSNESTLSYPTFLGHFSGINSAFQRTILPLRIDDINNVWMLLGTPEKEDQPFLAPPLLVSRLREFWNQIEFSKLKTAPSGWIIPRSWLPSQAELKVALLFRSEEPVRLYVPLKEQGLPNLIKKLESSGKKVKTALLHIQNGEFTISYEPHQKRVLPHSMNLYLEGGAEFPASLIDSSIEKAKFLQDVQFQVDIVLQNHHLSGITNSKQLLLADGKLKKGITQFWQNPNTGSAENGSFLLPKDFDGREGVLLPKSFRDVGAKVGDHGSLAYYMPIASTLQEQQIPIYVAGFYDQGIIPIGGKFIIANKNLVSLIRSAHNPDDKSASTNGINLHFENLDQAGKIKEELLKSLKSKGIDRYWRVETYRDFEFAQGIMQELQSQKTIFSLISIVIILVACSNIISMLIILVNDKKTEIGILRSMGATSSSIALIFGLAGGFIGLFSSLLGVGAALLTLDHLPLLMSWISYFQGHDLFSSAFYGETPPQELSYNALYFVLGATMLISLLAGVVPAIKACLVKPSQILRSGG